MSSESDSQERPPSKKEIMLQQANELAGQVITENQTLRAFFVQAVGRLHIITGTKIDGEAQAKEKWEEGLERYPKEAQKPAISALLDTFIAQISSTLLDEEAEDEKETT